MNKKIKMIELLNKIANGEEIPKKIDYQEEIYKWDEEAFKYADHTGYTLEIYTKKIDLYDEVEILEDNTEEIEELKPFDEIRDVSVWDNMVLSNNQRAIATKINEIIKYIKRKEKE